MFLLGALGAHASTIVFVTAPGATIGTAAVNDRITFITSANQVEIQIQNLQTNISVETQAIVAVDWLLNGFANAQPTSITMLTDANSTETGLGQVITISGSTSYTTALLSSITSRWSVSTSGEQLTGGSEITAIGGGKPNQLIIGPPNYNNPNAAITGHNPFLETDTSGSHISFVLDYAPSVGITAATTINSTTGFRPRLSFGTTFSTTQELDLIVETPEPETVVLSLAGIALMFAGRRWRGRKSSVA